MPVGVHGIPAGPDPGQKQQTGIGNRLDVVRGGENQTGFVASAPDRMRPVSHVVAHEYEIEFARKIFTFRNGNPGAARAHVPDLAIEEVKLPSSLATTPPSRTRRRGSGRLSAIGGNSVSFDLPISPDQAESGDSVKELQGSQ